MLPRPRPRPLALAAITLALIAAACGSTGDSASGDSASGDARTVEIEMRDIAYSPDTVTVAAGETVRFVFTNTGEALHDAYIGDRGAQDDHEAEMSDDSSGMDHGDMGDSSTDAITVEPGETGELIHTFAAGDDVLIGCHQPGHYDAGMIVTVDVT